MSVFVGIFRPKPKRFGEVLHRKRETLAHFAGHGGPHEDRSGQTLFAWDCLDDGPPLKTIRELLAALPDGKLLDPQCCSRDSGRQHYRSRRFHAKAGTVLIVQTAFAPLLADAPPKRPLGKMNLNPIAPALHKKVTV